MNRNLIFFDVDGTIIDAANYIPPSAIAAIHAAQEAGNLCVVNTGRPYSHLVPSVREIGFSGYICSCGQHIVLGGETVLHAGFDAELSAEIIRMIRACGMDAVLESEDGARFVLAPEPSPLATRNFAHYRELGFDPLASVDGPGFRFDKFCVWPNDPDRLGTFVRFIEPHCELIYRENHMIELVKKGYSKQTGIEFLMARLAMPPERTYALGDSTNDLTMFRCVGTSIVMGDAPEAVKQQASFVTRPFLQDGLAYGLAHFGLTGSAER